MENDDVWRTTPGLGEFAVYVRAVTSTQSSSN